MKPLKLTMQAFSAYANKTVINFETLNQKGLYLITGDTGTGKTTIFDGITYALFGEASGSKRSSDIFRSDYVTTDIPTFVELIFELHQHTYKVYREISYTKTGNKRPEVAVLYKDEELLTESKSEVTKTIEGLMGVDKNQFKQIVMIAQGEFSRLLTAPSKDKEVIFRKLFHTENLLQFETRLKEKSLQLKQKYEQYHERITTRLHSIEGYEDTLFTPTVLEELKEDIRKVKEELKVLEKQKKENELLYNKQSQIFQDHVRFNENVNSYQSLVRDYENYQKDASHYETLHTQIESVDKAMTLLPAYQQLEKDKEELVKKRNTLKDINTNYQELMNYDTSTDEEMIQRYSLEIQILIEKKHQYEQILEKKDVYENREKTIHSYKKEYEEIHSELETLNTSLEKIEETINTYKDSINKKEMIDKSYQLLLDIQSLIKELGTLESQYELVELSYTQKLNHYTSSFNRYQIEENKYKHNLAGIFASTLKENTPCPVCGSLHHPSLALREEGVLSSIELEEFKENVEKEKKEVDDAYADMQELHQKVELMRHDFHSKSSQLSIEGDDKLDEKIDAYKKELSQIEIYERELPDLFNKETKTRDSYDSKVKEAETLLKEIDSLSTLNRQLLKDYPDMMNYSSKTYNEYETQEKELNTSLHTLTEKLNQRQIDIVKYETKINDLRGSIDTLNTTITQEETSFTQDISKNYEDISIFYDSLPLIDHIQSMRKQYQEYMNECHRLTHELKKQESYKDKTLYDIETEEKELNDLKESHDAFNNHYSQLLFDYQNNQKTYKFIEKDYKTYQTIEKDYTDYEELYMITRGMSNKGKLSFERYVLAHYLNSILEYANRELRQLTSQRYELIRRDYSKGNGAQGLDLDILDYETGVKRDINSLSGGELFKASLSLALGLSYMIQDFNGGIELQTLFIDEGFGSLDQESLNQAINVLMGLQSSSKVIGIISHVEALKERIDTGIYVSKTNKGSQIEIF